MLNKHDCFLSGLHLEITAKLDVLECVNDEKELTADRRYESALDPCLNSKQCMKFIEKAFSNKP